jgi:hypothetical protein
VRLSIKEVGIARAPSALEHVVDAGLRGNVKTREVSLGNWSRELAEKTLGSIMLLRNTTERELETLM